jgi:cobalamin-dependent methionine synthase I
MSNDIGKNIVGVVYAITTRLLDLGVLCVLVIKLVAAALEHKADIIIEG